MRTEIKNINLYGAGKSTFQVQTGLWRIIPEPSLPLAGNFFTVSNPTSEEFQAVTDRYRYRNRYKYRLTHLKLSFIIIQKLLSLSHTCDTVLQNGDIILLSYRWGKGIKNTGNAHIWNSNININRKNVQVKVTWKIRLIFRFILDLYVQRFYAKGRNTNSRDAAHLKNTK